MTQVRGKVLFLCSWYRETPDSVAGVFFAEQVAAVADSGYEVAIACCARLRSFRELRALRFLSTSRREVLSGSVGADVYRGEIGVLPAWAGALNDRLRRWQFARFLRRVIADFGRPDIVHIQSAIDAGISAFELLRAHGIPYVITEHGSFYRRQQIAEWKLPLARRCFAGAHAAFAVSTALIEDLRRAGVDSRLDVLPNMYDGDVFNLDGVNRHDVFTFLMVCQVRFSVKGVDTALQAFAEVLRQNENCRLLIAGDGPDTADAHSLIDELGIAAQAKLLEHQTRESVSRLMKESHCIVSASRIETFGVTLIEGLACGLSVIATRSGGPEDFIHPPHGVLVPIDDPGALAAAMVETMRNYDGSAEAQAARNAYVQENYSRQAFCDRLLPVYDAARAASQDSGDLGP